MLSFFSSMFFWPLYQKSGLQGCVDLCLDFQFNLIDQHLRFMQIPYYFYYYNFVVQLQIKNNDAQTLLLLFRIVLGVLDFFLFLYEV